MDLILDYTKTFLETIFWGVVCGVIGGSIVAVGQLLIMYAAKKSGMW